MSKVKCITIPVYQSIGPDCNVINDALEHKQIPVESIINIQETVHWATIWYRV